MHQASKWQEWYSQSEEVGFSTALRACRDRSVAIGEPTRDRRRGLRDYANRGMRATTVAPRIGGTPATTGVWTGGTSDSKSPGNVHAEQQRS
jgi:hypothetical protein